jgi:hypothetical protein
VECLADVKIPIDRELRSGSSFQIARRADDLYASRQRAISTICLSRTKKMLDTESLTYHACGVI